MLSNRFEDALAFAAATHRGQTRKGSGTPYVAHLLSVAALTLEYGGDEDCAIAALLHDAIEDQGGRGAAAAIGKRFGPHVEAIVRECSDGVGGGDLPWRARKEAYLAAIPGKSDAAILVTSCDKLHNATAILQDLISDGLSVFQRFAGRQSGTLWYYRALAEALQLRNPGPLSARLAATVLQIEYFVNSSD